MEREVGIGIGLDINIARDSILRSLAMIHSIAGREIKSADTLNAFMQASAKRLVGTASDLFIESLMVELPSVNDGKASEAQNKEYSESIERFRRTIEAQAQKLSSVMDRAIRAEKLINEIEEMVFCARGLNAVTILHERLMAELLITNRCAEETKCLMQEKEAQSRMLNKVLDHAQRAEGLLYEIEAKISANRGLTAGIACRDKFCSMNPQVDEEKPCSEKS
jgi:hypothetical protein